MLNALTRSTILTVALVCFVSRSFSKDPTTAQDDYLDVWTTDLISAYHNTPAPNRMEMPAAFKPVGAVQRLRNELFLWILKKKIKGNAEGTPTELKRTISNLDGPLSFVYRGPLYKAVADLLDKSEDPESALNKTMKNIERIAQEFYQDIEGYKVKYGKEFFSEDAISRGVTNAVAMHLFAETTGHKVIDRHAVNALALLHPITDEVIDSGNFDPKTLAKITGLLNGTRPEASTPYEHLVFDFIGNMYRAFPAEQHPIMDHALKTLHELQIQSAMQRMGKMSSEKMLDLTFRKGGLSTVLAGYMALGELSNRQHEFFYKAGAIFQIMDDLADIAPDQRDKVLTVLTQALAENHDIQEPMRRFLHLEQAFEQELPRISKDFAKDGLITDLYKQGYKVTVFKSMLRHSEPEILSAWKPLRDHLQLRPETMSQVFHLFQSSVSSGAIKCSDLFRRMIVHFDAY